MVDYKPTHSKALWDRDREVVYAIDREEVIFPTGEPRPKDANTVWLPIHRALPEDRIDGQEWLLGPSVFEVDVHYDPDVVLEHYPDADFSEEAFRYGAEQKAINSAQAGLAETDWMVIRNQEKGDPIPDEIIQARQAIRDAVGMDLDRLDDLTPVEFVEFAPMNVHGAVKFARETLKAHRHHSRGRVYPTPEIPEKFNPVTPDIPPGGPGGGQGGE